jgi:hypothetical protein
VISARALPFNRAVTDQPQRTRIAKEGADSLTDKLAGLAEAVQVRDERESGD